jgi:putative DNA primase/helicase
VARASAIVDLGREQLRNRQAQITPADGAQSVTTDADAPEWEATTLVTEREPVILPSEYSDDSLALAFTERHHDRLRYTDAWNKWHEWDGSRWKEDTTLDVFDKSRKLCREIAAGADSKKIRSDIASARTVANVERLARSDRRHAARSSQWDANPWVISTPGGVVDLRTGESRAAKPEDYITRQTAVVPGGCCPRWLEFLAWASCDDSEFVAFIQRMAGYSLTGSIEEHALFFCYGTGGNGKGTMVNAIAGILGEYAAVASMETFTESQGERHPTDLAMLRGARLVTSEETERGRRWNDRRIKAITGGSPISARFMRQDFFTFAPEFKLLLVGNEKPSIDSVDEAMRRRFHLLPFDQKISADKRDLDLPEKLREEWPGILAWMIEGCLLWQEKELQPPERVIAATEAYLNDQNSFLAWVEECCLVGQTEWASSASLYRSWSTWATRHGEKPGTARGLSEELQKNGFHQKPMGHAKTRGYAGLSALSDTINAFAGDR